MLCGGGVMKPVRKIPPKCKTCRFFSGGQEEERLSWDDRQCSHGVCRRYAPRPVMAGEESDYCNFPIVSDTDWCGEWQGKGGK